jgi:protein-S-isoprenylcysteine O-methyltransferase Ste14
MPPLIFFLFLFLSFVLNSFFPIARVSNSWYFLSGALALAGGVLISGWTIFLFKKRKNTLRPRKDPQELEIYGPFRFTRNPIYLGLFLVLLGTDMLLGSFSLLVFPVLFLVIINTYVIPFEEKNLERIFGSQYLGYKRSVRRWL